MDTLAMQPYKIIAIPGGIKGVIIEETAVTTVEKDLENPAFSISGTIIFASMAASARLEPDSPPISVDSSTFTWASPPVIRPVSMEQKFIILEVTPV